MDAQGNAAAAAPVVVRADRAERLRFPSGSTMTLLADGPQTSGALGVHRTVLRDGGEGASPHHHVVTTEVLYIVRGGVQLLVGDEVVHVRHGDLVVVPPGAVHAFAATPGSDAEVLVAVTPGIERFSMFRRFAAVSSGRVPTAAVGADASTSDTYADTSEAWDRARNHIDTKENTVSTTTNTNGTGSEHRTMNTVIHAAFRRDLRRVGDALDRFPDGPPTRARDLAAAWRNLAHQLHVHHVDEETLFWPAFVELGVDTAVIADLEGEHEQMVAALTAAEASMEALAEAPTAEHARAARACVVTLQRVLDDHLAHEERDLEPFGAEHVDTPQHKAAVARARRSHTEGVGTFFAWLSDTDDPGVTAALRREVPRPVLFVLTTLGGRRYRRLAAAAWS